MCKNEFNKFPKFCKILKQYRSGVGRNLFAIITAGRRSVQRRRRWRRHAVQRDSGRVPYIIALTRTAVSMSPEILAGLETFTAALTRVRTSGRVNSLVKTNSWWIFEPLSTDAALARVVIAVFVQVVLLQVYLCKHKHTSFLPFSPAHVWKIASKNPGS